MLHLFVGLGMIFLLIFAYTPMFGIIMAFKRLLHLYRDQGHFYERVGRVEAFR